MKRKLEKMIQAGKRSNQPTLSVFVNLKNEDHSFTKLKGIFLRAQNELSKKGLHIDKLDEILGDNLISGRELEIASGLSDVNLAIYVCQNDLFAFPATRTFNDTYHLDKRPYILPIIEKSYADIKAMVMMRKFSCLYGFEKEELRLLTNDFPRLNEDELENFDNQMVQDRTKKRSDEMIRRLVRKTLEMAQQHWKAKDRILIIAKEEFAGPTRSFMDTSRWKKTYIVEHFNFQHPDNASIERKIYALIEKNRMNHFREVDNAKTKAFSSLNTVKKDVGTHNIKRFWINDELLDSTINNTAQHKELNDFLLTLIQNGAAIASYENLEENFTVDMRNIDIGKHYDQL